MDWQLKALKEEVLRGQEEVTEKAVKKARRECEYPFNCEGNWEQSIFLWCTEEATLLQKSIVWRFMQWGAWTGMIWEW